MTWLKTKTLLFISLFLIGCGSKTESTEETNPTIQYEEVSYSLEIGADRNKIEEELISKGLKKVENTYHGSFENLNVEVKLSGSKFISEWKISWKGSKEAINTFHKRFENVLKTKFKDLQEKDGYYSTRFRLKNTDVILEYILSETKIELTNR